MSIHEDFKAPLHRFDDLSPETIDYHVAQARRIRSQLITAQVKRLSSFIVRMFSRQKNVSNPAGFAANQT
jgi:hypothetical protein